MKKVILWGTIVFGMFGILVTSTTTVNAATWHKGVPTILKHSYWQGKDTSEFWSFNNEGVHYYRGYTEYISGHPMYKVSKKSYTIRTVGKKNAYYYVTATKINHNKFRFFYPYSSTDQMIDYTYLYRM
ncbi:hypothetical protein [Lentilactobacillus kosonis]|uniref:Uncharacterized protein n=1 Tax=Lentilactobacillus kosonis TaxID=2810561 RepID=A0A401FIB8_9LACO|nr:hypothetical protein [Lentilactobacillus kosonis]GAY72046.1 hypothetical protein NBRC111893_192 [Lentilactobacillus kosonis]